MTSHLTPAQPCAVCFARGTPCTSQEILIFQFTWFCREMEGLREIIIMLIIHEDTHFIKVHYTNCSQYTLIYQKENNDHVIAFFSAVTSVKLIITISPCLQDPILA